LVSVNNVPQHFILSTSHFEHLQQHCINLLQQPAILSCILHIKGGAKTLLVSKFSPQWK